MLLLLADPPSSEPSPWSPARQALTRVTRPVGGVLLATTPAFSAGSPVSRASLPIGPARHCQLWREGSFQSPFRAWPRAAVVWSLRLVLLCLALFCSACPSFCSRAAPWCCGGRAFSFLLRFRNQDSVWVLSPPVSTSTRFFRAQPRYGVVCVTSRSPALLTLRFPALF